MCGKRRYLQFNSSALTCISPRLVTLLEPANQQEISVMVLTEMKVTHAVLTVPAYFNDTQRQVKKFFENNEKYI